MARKKKELTPEEQREYALQNDYQDKMRNAHFIPEPNYTFAVGDKVAIGCLIDPVVEEVLENGKLYRIRYAIKHNNYGHPYIEENMEKYSWWHELRPVNKATESLIANEDVRLDYSPMVLSSLLSRYYFFGTNMNPEYQRDYVWSEEDKIALIDSIFNGIDIGKFAYIHTEDYREGVPLYEILDGKQRLRAILDYYENRFPYKGKYFNDLCKRDQNWFENYRVSVADTRGLTQQQILRYFVSLNSQGRIMDAAHLDKVRSMIV
jgi:hypothetical protein